MAERIPFRSLPLLVRLTTMLSLFLSWLLFAELVIDRHGLDAYLPLYRAGAVCPYEVAVLLLLAASWWRLHQGDWGDASAR